MNKICYVATIPHVVFSFLSGHIKAAAVDYDVTVISHPQDAELLKNLPCRYVKTNIHRKISLWNDVKTLFHLIKFFRKERFLLVHSIMPKTGFLSMLAGWITGVPCRIHTFTGQVWATQHGFKRNFLKLFDKLIVAMATHTLADSDSQRRFLCSEGILKANQGIVIENGSICGVDTVSFCPDIDTRSAIRKSLNISPDAIIILFLGRLNRDKGMLDLAHAFCKIAACRKDLYLLLVGAEEDVPYTRIQEICGKHAENLRRIPFTSHPHHYMAAADIFCLPSYREGFGQTIIEAAACAIPTVATRIYGITDAVEENETGLLIDVGNIEQLAAALLKLIDDPSLRKNMGHSARARALQFFNSDKVTQKLIELYHSLLASFAGSPSACFVKTVTGEALKKSNSEKPM